MTDRVEPAIRSKMMSSIRCRDTEPERIIRKLLHSRGFRFRLNSNKLPGKPDLVLPKYSAVIFVHGCFWHGHNCKYFRLPSSRRLFWEKKIDSNRQRDRLTSKTLRNMGWRVIEVWECALRAKPPEKIQELGDSIASWLSGKSASKSIRG
jgi:DNA mismatch endonuclease (patch repair protein)